PWCRRHPDVPADRHRLRHHHVGSSCALLSSSCKELAESHTVAPSSEGPSLYFHHFTGRLPAALGRTALQRAALWIGVIFLLIGIAGFIPGVTTNYDQMAFAGAESEALLLGIFQVSILHNIVHLLFGVWGLAAARSFSGSRMFLIGGGLIYGLLWVYG